MRLLRFSLPTIDSARRRRSLSGRFRQVNNPIAPIPFAPFIRPEPCQQSGLLTVICAAHRPTKEYESAMCLASTENLAGMPWKRRPIERHQNEGAFGAGDEQRGIVQPQPRPLLPLGDVDDREFVNQTPACRNETVRRVFVSQQLVPRRFLRHAMSGFRRETPWRRRGLA